MVSKAIKIFLDLFIRLRMVWIKYFCFDPLISKTKQPSKYQDLLLRSILKANKGTVYGKQLGLERINSYREFIATVNVHTYEDLRMLIENQEIKKKPMLNAEQPIMYAQTSGTTGEPKYVPILKSTVKNYKYSQNIFAYAQYSTFPDIFFGKVLAIVSPDIEGFLETGTPFGSMSGFIYKSMPSILHQRYVLPSEIFEIDNYDDKYYLIAAFALAESEITMLATANPSTILKILNIINENSVQLIRDIETGELSVKSTLDCVKLSAIKRRFNRLPERANKLKFLVKEKGFIGFSDVWPNLRLVSTWTSGNCSVLLPSLRKQLATNAVISEMGYMASEFRGSITIDIANNIQIPTIHENFFEFVQRDDWENNIFKFKRLTEVEKDAQYYIIVTTQNGLYRYFINDIVEVTGWYNNTPTIRFVQKGRGVTNLTGEKLYETQVTNAVMNMMEDMNTTFEFFIMIAHRESSQYTLYVQHENIETRLEIELDQRLCKLNIEYENKRKSGRLGPVRVQCLRDKAAEEYKSHCIQKGQREGQFKMVRLQYDNECNFDFNRYIVER